ncbi:hypothetical protein ACRALDRAFT_1073288 [Sodiomyces alcalophilus JCM 7366]|uniref:uncharacterized protein n=1 Tax=Sodiomyces alcalophilus JCM 7366 TaxID=591952 RepID=UPI0039B46F52
MSVFSSIRKARSHAKEHKEKRTEQEKKEKESHVPYRHIPTHAASDALANAPPSWRIDDREKIVEQNRRRSAMAASGMNMKMPGPPRIASSLSQISFPAAHANPIGNLPRAYSYTGVPPMPGWGDYGSDAVYSPSLKGKDVERSFRFDSGRTSSLSGKGSPAGSSSDSTSSQDNLEIRLASHRNGGTIIPLTPSIATAPSLFHQAAPTRPAHRLHPRSRRASDTSDRGDPTPARAATISMHDRRPPPSMITRGYNTIPTGPARHVQLPGTLPRAEPTASSSATTSTPSLLQSNPPNHPSAFASFDFGTVTSSVASSGPPSLSTSSKSSMSNSAPTTPAAIIIRDEPIWKAARLPLPASQQQEVASQQQKQPPSPAKAKNHRVPKAKVTRFTEHDMIDSIAGHSSNMEPSLVAVTVRPASALSRESVPPTHKTPRVASPEPMPDKVGKRLSKQRPGRGKLQKKTRQSQASSAVAVS